MEATPEGGRRKRRKYTDETGLTSDERAELAALSKIAVPAGRG